MTIFARFYDKRTLVEISMDNIEFLIQNEINKQKIAEAIFHRYYDRYLKIFFYKTNTKANYTKIINGRKVSYSKNIFTEEYKSGFSMMTNCCLLIETIAAFFEGQNKTNKSGEEIFNIVFQKAATYKNPLKDFKNKRFYSEIRCGLLHQGELYGKFKIRRDSMLLFDKKKRIINAKLFCDNLKLFLKSYENELKSEKWDSDLWDKCRIKLRHIISNSK
jgi:hypothetical protein